MKLNPVQQAALKFLKTQRLAAISTITSDRRPQAAMIYYGVDHQLNLYFATGTLSRKFKNLKGNQRVALAVASQKKLTTVQLEGTVSSLKSTPKSKMAIKILAKALGPTIMDTLNFIWDPVPPVIKMKNGSLAILKVKPDWIRFADFSQSVAKTKGKYFEEWKAK